MIASEVRLRFQPPLDAAGLLQFLARRAISGVEEPLPGGHRRSLRLAHGAGVLELEFQQRRVAARYWLEDIRDREEAITRTRALLDLDAEQQEILDALGDDELIGPLVRANPGLRVPGSTDANEVAVRAVLGQQVSLAGAATLAARLVAAYGQPLPQPVGAVTHVFPSPAVLAEADPAHLAMPAGRKRAVYALTSALAAGELRLNPTAEHHEVRQRLLALPGVGPWTADYIALRALRDRDAFLASDLGIRRALAAMGQDDRPAAIERLAERWRPYRAYAFQHLLTATIPA